MLSGFLLDQALTSRHNFLFTSPVGKALKQISFTDLPVQDIKESSYLNKFSWYLIKNILHCSYI